MPIIARPLSPGGAVIDVLVGVSVARRDLLTRHGLQIPPPVPVRVLIDTGSSHTLFATRVFREIAVGPVGKEAIYTPSTLPGRPHECDLFATTLWVVADGAPRLFGDWRVIGADCWLEGESIEGLVGRDVLDHCNFWYLGKDRAFNLAFD